MIRPIVEGDGDEKALPLLLYRLMADLGVYGVGVMRMPARTPYRETTDQPALSTQFDLGQAYQRASSFRKLVKELCRILTDMGHQPVIPTEWTSV